MTSKIYGPQNFVLDLWIDKLICINSRMQPVCSYLSDNRTSIIHQWSMQRELDSLIGPFSIKKETDMLNLFSFLYVTLTWDIEKVLYIGSYFSFVNRVVLKTLVIQG